MILTSYGSNKSPRFEIRFTVAGSKKTGDTSVVNAVGADVFGYGCLCLVAREGERGRGRLGIIEREREREREMSDLSLGEVL